MGSMADMVYIQLLILITNQCISTRRNEAPQRDCRASFQSKTYASTAHNLQVCHTYKSVWLEYASKPLAQKDTFYKQNEAALQTYCRAASQLDKMGISQLIEPEKIQRLVSETENRISDLIAELEKNAEKLIRPYRKIRERSSKFKIIKWNFFLHKDSISFSFQEKIAEHQLI